MPTHCYHYYALQIGSAEWRYATSKMLMMVSTSLLTITST